MTTEGPVPPTRAARRAHAARSAPAPVLDVDAPPIRPRPLVVTATVVAGLVLAAAAVLSSHLVLVAVLVTLGLVTSIGWPRLARSATPRSATTVLVVTTLALGVAVTLRDEEPYLDHVPAALALGVVAMCLHPLVVARAREELAATLATSALGIGVLTCGAVLITTPDGVRTPLLAAGVALAVAAVPDLLTERRRSEAWMLPVGILVGGLVGLGTEMVAGGGLEAWSALVGMLGAGVALSLRRVLAQSRAVDGVAGGVAAGVASVLVSGPVVHLVARAFLG